eukprot:TRINITY_DN15032_c0_g1_i1.p1 TRINITY_DN15032_c0_g1~~TRINITY_DN15032_c0_g1_i1.p1  ORF type:complete len:294 (+),score=23.11 TRINITY_DN15032_c0_g1_i1:98-979(+)
MGPSGQSPSQAPAVQQLSFPTDVAFWEAMLQAAAQSGGAAYAAPTYAVSASHEPGQAHDLNQEWVRQYIGIWDDAHEAPQGVPSAPTMPSDSADGAARGSLQLPAPAYSPAPSRLCHHGCLALHCGRCDPVLVAVGLRAWAKHTGVAAPRPARSQRRPRDELAASAGGAAPAPASTRALHIHLSLSRPPAVQRPAAGASCPAAGGSAAPAPRSSRRRRGPARPAAVPSPPDAVNAARSTPEASWARRGAPHPLQQQPPPQCLQGPHWRHPAVVADMLPVFDQQAALHGRPLLY